MSLNLPQELLEKLRRHAAAQETPDELLTQLEKSELLSSDFPRRCGMTHEEVAADTAAYWRAKAADSAPASAVAIARGAI